MICEPLVIRSTSNGHDTNHPALNNVRLKMWTLVGKVGSHETEGKGNAEGSKEHPIWSMVRSMTFRYGQHMGFLNGSLLFAKKGRGGWYERSRTTMSGRFPHSHGIRLRKAASCARSLKGLR